MLYIIQSLKLGTRSLVRNTSLVFLAVCAIICIQALLIGALFGKAVFGYALHALERRVDIRLSMVVSATTEQQSQIIDQIRLLPHVSEIQAISAADTYKSFSERHANDFLTLQALKELGGNPFGHEIVVKLDKTSSYPDFLANLENPEVMPAELLSLVEDIDTVQNDQLVQRLAHFESISRQVALAISVVAFAIVFVVLSVVSRLFLAQYAPDVQVMRTFGVSESHIGAWLCTTYTFCVVIATAVSVLGASFLARQFDTFLVNMGSGASLSVWYQDNLLAIIGFMFFTTLAVVHIITALYLSAKK